jgi:hypothetical protein
MDDEKRRRRLLWIAIIIAALAVIGATSIIFDSTMTFGRIVLVLLLIPVILLVFAMIVNPPPKGTGDPTQPIVKEYEDKNVTVTVKYQGFAVDVLRLPSPPLEEMRAATGGLPDEFTPYRVLLNVVVARQDNPDLLVTKFNTPIEIRMGYTTVDLKRAKEKENLDRPQFGFWDGCRWILFTEKKHQLRYEPANRSDLAGYAVVTLSEWADPALAAGP